MECPVYLYNTHRHIIHIFSTSVFFVDNMCVCTVYLFVYVCEYARVFTWNSINHKNLFCY